jgi:glucokinase
MSSNVAAPLRLIADIGGTNARFALLEDSTRRDERVLACADYPDLATATQHYLGLVSADTGARRPVEAAMAIASRITGDAIHMTNHVWQFSASQVRRGMGWKRFIVLNDFTALAMAVRHLPPEELESIGAGRSAPGMPLALLGPGTGLGVSGLVPAGAHWIPLQGEGGHVTLSVVSEREIAVYKQLRQRFSHVSAERAVTGPGLINLYRALCALEGVVPE